MNRLVEFWNRLADWWTDLGEGTRLLIAFVLGVLIG